MNSNTAESIDIVELMERNRAEAADHEDDFVIMINKARQGKREKARRVAENAARKTMEEAEELRHQKYTDPDVFVKLLMERPVKVQVIQEQEQKKSIGLDGYIGSLFTGLFAGIAAVLAAMVFAGVL